MTRLAKNSQNAASSNQANNACQAVAIKVDHLSHGYSGRTVLNEITLTIEAGSFTVLLGKNGSGKSTLFRLIAGFLPITEGAVYLQGRPAPSLSGRERARLLGFLPQQHRPVFPFSVRDVVLTGRAGQVRFSPGRYDQHIADNALVRVGIEQLGNRLFTELSGGEQQLVMLARVLAQEPQIILLDEPISHLDLAYQARVMSILRTLATDGLAIFAILHDPNFATLYADRLICLKNGHILEDSAGANLRPQTLSSVYGMELVSINHQGRLLVLPATEPATPQTPKVTCHGQG